MIRGVADVKQVTKKGDKDFTWAFEDAIAQFVKTMARIANPASVKKF